VLDQELPYVLAQLRTALKPGGVLFYSISYGSNDEGWNAGRYGAYYDLETWRFFMSRAGFSNRITITDRPDCHANFSRGWPAYGDV